MNLLDKQEIFRISGDAADIHEIQNGTDITIPLLSVDFVNDEDFAKIVATISNWYSTCCFVTMYSLLMANNPSGLLSIL